MRSTYVVWNRTEEKIVLMSGFEPECRPRKGRMIGRYTTWASSMSAYYKSFKKFLIRCWWIRLYFQRGYVETRFDVFRSIVSVQGILTPCVTSCHSIFKIIIYFLRNYLYMLIYTALCYWTSDSLADSPLSWGHVDHFVGAYQNPSKVWGWT